MIQAYSYIRFSTAKQLAGDSLRRQTDLAKSYASKHNLTLDDRSFLDLGISGFDRSNIERGALAAFLVAVKDGTIRQGSYLLIETFDRLSRASISVAIRLLLDLTAAGIVVITLMDEKVWTADTINDLPNLMYSLMLMSRAHEESATKSKRLREAWGKKKANAGTKPLTAECPQWLILRQDRTGFDIIEERAESVKNVFLLRTAGHGSTAIARKANAEQWAAPSFSGTWHTSLISRLLHNRATLGEYQPHETRDGKRIPVGEPVHGYYPPIISQDLWAGAQAVAIRHTNLPRRRSYRNVLQGLLKCSCGANFVRKNKASAKQPEYAIYYCTNRMRNVTHCASVPAIQMETTLLNHAALLSPSVASIDEQAKALESQIDSFESAKNALTTRQQRLIEAIEESDRPIQALTQQLNKIQDELDSISSNLDISRNTLLDLQNIDSDDAFESMYSILRDGTDEQRSALRERLLRLLTHVEVYPRESYLRIHSRISGLPPIVAPLSQLAVMPNVAQHVSQTGTVL